MSESKTPKPIPIGTPAVLVAVVAVVIGAVGLAPTAADWRRAARPPSPNNLTGLSPPHRPRPVPPDEALVDKVELARATLSVV